MLKSLFVFILLICTLTMFSQAYLMYPETNPVLQKKNQLKSMTTKTGSIYDTLELPFFDDFAKNLTYPDTAHWTDNYAYINQSLGIDPPSIGVATLDAINNKGEIYENANTVSFVADYLTSKPINLDVDTSLTNTVFFSFMYQPQGLSDSPEPIDSLVLEFYSPVDAQWHYQWRAAGDSVHEFKKVMVQVKDSIYLKNGFRFRFKNYASLSSNNDYPGRKGNVDFWHLDWIYLNKFRNEADTFLNDAAFRKPLQSILSDYEAVPWKHFYVDTNIFNDATITSTFTNYYSEDVNVNLTIDITNVKNNNTTYFAGVGLIPDFTPGITVVKEKLVENNPFPLSYDDSTTFLVRSYLIKDTVSATQMYRNNDTLKYYQKFYNYYAYDDGSAEAGFGMDGQQTENAKAAVKFKAHKEDTLQAIQMYFNQTKNDVSQVYIKYTVWEDNNGTPGNIIYQSEGIKIEYQNHLNEFTTFMLDTTIILSGNFWVGWQQIENMFINIGFDFNRLAGEKQKYNIFGTWAEIEFNGSLMIRPVFGDPFIIQSANNNLVKQNKKITVYPNPAQNSISIKGNIDLNKILNVEIYDIYGKLVISTNYNNNQISTENLSSGIYIIKVNTNSTNPIIEKFIISR